MGDREEKGGGLDAFIGSGPISFEFDGTEQLVNMILVNPYTGDKIAVNETKNLNQAIYTGGVNQDAIFMTSLGDALFIRSGLSSNQIVSSVEIFFAGEGGDILYLADSSFVLGDITVLGGAGNDIIWSNIGSDFIQAEGGNDHVVTGAGNDEVYGDEGDDFINGGEGNDILNGGSGDDTLVGGAGADVYHAGIDNDTIIESGNGEANVIYVLNQLSSDLTYQAMGRDLMITLHSGASITGTIRVVDHFVGQKGVDTLVLNDGFGASISLRNLGIGPTTGDDVLVGGNGVDHLYGGLGSDSLSAGGGNDFLYYSSDATWPTQFVAWNVGSPDSIINGERITVNPRDRNFDGFNGGSGYDTLIMGDEGEALFLDDRYSANPFGTNTARLISVEEIHAGGGNDIVDLTSKQFSYGDVKIYGEDGNDVLWSSAGNDVLDGGDGNDNLDGGTGNDTLIGGAGNDVMYGRAGNDVFHVGEGLDTIYTGTGIDTVLFDFMDGNLDVIKDFKLGSGGDILDISNILEGYNMFFSVAEDFIDLVYDNATNKTTMFINHDGDLGGVYAAVAIFEGINTSVQDMLVEGNLILA